MQLNTYPTRSADEAFQTLADRLGRLEQRGNEALERLKQGQERTLEGKPQAIKPLTTDIYHHLTSLEALHLILTSGAGIDTGQLSHLDDLLNEIKYIRHGGRCM